MDIRISKSKFLPCYHHLLPATMMKGGSEFFDIDFLYGGRDSGKSRHTAMQLVLSCIHEEYFKCLLIRKVLNTVRDSQYNLIKSVIEEWGIAHLFSFNSSRLEITCVHNGNTFSGRGLDDVGRIKSFNNPSHCWIEEGNQIENEDFVVILTSLRANQRVKTWFTFNPECESNYTEFWLYQEWFSHSDSLSWTWNKDIQIDGKTTEYKIRATHTTYKDNPYCAPQRIALYESYKHSKNNAYWYQTYTLGLWGYRKTGGEFWKCFDESMHVRKIKPIDRPYHITVDNNYLPYVSVQIWQVDTSNQTLMQIHELPCTSPNNNAPKAARHLCKWLRSVGYEDVVFIYGDPSANAHSTTDENNDSFFDKFLSEIRSDGFSVSNRIAKSHPEVALSASFINEIYESEFEGWRIEINDTCSKSIEDYKMVKEALDGTMLKTRVKDKFTGQSYEKYGHMSDAKRYFVCKVLDSVFRNYKVRRSKSWGIAV